MGERLVVIGGTAAGLSAASKAKRMCPSMDITVYERSGFVSYGACGLPYFVGGMIADAEDLVSLNVQTLSEKRGIPTYTHHEVTSIDRQAKPLSNLMINWSSLPALLPSYRVFPEHVPRAFIACGRWRTASP